MGLLVVASFLFGLFSSNGWCITQTLAGPLASGKWTGLQNCAGNLAGVVAPVVTGTTVKFDDFVNLGDRRFYRLRVE